MLWDWLISQELRSTWKINTKSGKGGGNICNHLPGTQTQFEVFRKCGNLMSMEKRLGMLLLLDPNYGNSSGKEKTWHSSMGRKYAGPVGMRCTKKEP